MKKIVWIFIIALIGSFVFVAVNNFLKKEPNPNLEKGYTEEEVAVIETLSEENKNYLLETNYHPNLLEYFAVENMIEEKLINYIQFHEAYGLNLNETVYIVNHNYDDLNVYDESTIAFMHGDYYIHEYLNRYLTYQTQLTVSFDSVETMRDYVITAVNSNLDYAFYTQDYAVDLEKNELILVNKYYKLPSDYVPENLVKIEYPYGVSLMLQATVYEQYKLMWEAAKSQGLSLYIRSPYRSFATQNTLYNNYVARDGKAAADTYSARPGYSEHQTGLAFDVTSPTTNFDTFEYSKEFEWLQENAYQYGFILRYPKEKEYITGYMYEPWHYRYVGVDVATKIHETGLTYEEYYAYYVR